MDENKKRINWQAVLVVFLLLVLIGQTAYLIRLKKGDSREYPRAVQAVRRAPAATFSATLPGASDPWDTMQTGSEWDPFREMEDMRRVMNRMFRESYSHGLRSTGSALPALSYNPDVDFQEAANEYVVRLDLPGIDKDKISVKTENGMLTLSGERSAESEQTGQNGGFYRTERSFGSFARSFPLPPDAEADKVTAESKNGVLTVHIPKAPGAKKPASSIPVQ